ncbi:MAG TPA: PIN domain-containing protein [Verrucomicrobiae bacterium]|nr:PIN domain-containing protein [Verrucomicrobiae bacterium]
MKYLLDVNVLVALGFLQHEFHGRVAGWVRTLASRGIPELATCSITELGFVRVLAQAPQYGFTIAHARTLLLRLKRGNSLRFTFIPDDHDVSHIPAWVKTAKQITDGHLVQLAKAKNAILATLDDRIPGAFLIPTQR